MSQHSPHPGSIPHVRPPRPPPVRRSRGWAVLAPLLAALILATAGLPVQAGSAAAVNCDTSPFHDVCPDAWFYSPVMDLLHAGVLSGYQDGTFRPYNGITRGQFAKVLVLATGVTGADPSAPTFADVPASHPFFHVVALAAAQGWIAGYACGGPGEPCDALARPYFRPGAALSRGQMAKMLALAFAWDDPMPARATFVDVPPGSPFFAFVEQAAAEGTMSGYSCGGPGEPCNAANAPYFRPSASSTRAQVSKIVSNSRGHGHRTPTPPPPPAATPRPPTATPTAPVPIASSTAAVPTASATVVPPGATRTPTPTRTPRPPTATRTPWPPSATPTDPPAITATPPAATATPWPPSATPTDPPGATATSWPPSVTPTRIPSATATPHPPSASPTPHPPTSTATPRPPTATATPRPPTATATTQPPSPTPPPPGQCPVLPADNIWNRNVSAVPTVALSSSYISHLGGSGTILHPGFGACCWQGQAIGQPFVAVQNQPLVPIHFTAYGSQSDPGPYPIPTDAPIEGCQTCGGDRHVLVEDLDTCTLYEMYHAYPQADGSWNADQGSIFHLTSNALRPDGWTSADAAGLPIYPGLVRYDEVQAGAIHHAIRFTADVSLVSRNWIWPARHSDGEGTGSTDVPMGSRFRLKASVDISGFTPQVRVILQALKDYGMVLADTDGSGGQIDIDGLADDRWSNSTLHVIEQLHASDFEVVDVSGLMIDPNSGQSR